MNILFFNRIIQMLESLMVWKKDQPKKQLYEIGYVENVDLQEKKDWSKTNEIIKMSLFMGHR